VEEVGKRRKHVSIIRYPRTSRIDYHHVHFKTSMKRQPTFLVWVNHSISQCTKWWKRINSCYNYQVTSLVKDRLCANMPTQRQLTDWVWVNHTIWQCRKWRKRIIEVVKSDVILYKCITLHRGQWTVKYIHSEVTYHLSVAEVDQFTDCQCSKLVRKWKQASLDTHNRRLITYTSRQRLPTSWV